MTVSSLVSMDGFHERNDLAIKDWARDKALGSAMLSSLLEGKRRDVKL